MARPLKPIDPASSPFGHELRRWRLLRGLKLGELGERMGFSHSYLSQVEHGHQKPTRQFAELADRALRAGGALLRVHENATGDANSQQIDRDFAIVASLAELTALVDDEMSGIIGKEDDVERRNALKLAGAAALELTIPAAVVTGNDAGPSGALDPELVRYYEGVTALYRHQDRKLGSPAVVGPVAQHVERLMAHLGATPERDPVWPLLAVAAADAAQLAGWMSFDQLQWDRAQHWYQLYGRLALKAHDFEMYANSVTNLARVQIEQGHHQQAMTSLEQLARLRVSRATEANIAVHRAHALVAAGEERAALSAFDEAQRILEAPDAAGRPPTVPFMSNMGAWHIEDWRGLSFIRLGRPKLALPSLEKGLAGKSHRSWGRSSGESLLNLGNAYLDAGELDEACAKFAQAFPVLSATRSQRHLRTFLRLHKRLMTKQDAKSVRGLNEVVRASGGSLPPAE
jgi:transcriptional regulator with XRE-family HTH domain